MIGEGQLPQAGKTEDLSVIEVRDAAIEVQIEGIGCSLCRLLILRGYIDRLRPGVVCQEREAIQKAPLQCQLQRVVGGVSVAFDKCHGAEVWIERAALVGRGRGSSGSINCRIA